MLALAPPTDAVRPLTVAQASKVNRHAVVVTDAAHLAVRANQQAVVIIAIDRAGEVSTHCYGETGLKAEVIGQWGRAIVPVMFDARLFALAFGTGANGHPRGLSPEDFGRLSPGARAHAIQRGAEPC